MSTTKPKLLTADDLLRLYSRRGQRGIDKGGIVRDYASRVQTRQDTGQIDVKSRGIC